MSRILVVLLPRGKQLLQAIDAWRMDLFSLSETLLQGDKIKRSAECYKEFEIVIFRLAILLVLMWVLFLTDVLAFSSVKILEVSISGQTICVDTGMVDGLKPRGLAKFYIQTSIDRPTLRLVAEGEAVKVHGRYSYFYLKKIEHKAQLKKGNRLIFAYEDQVLQGRVEYNTLSKIVVLPESKTRRQYIKDREAKVPEYLQKKVQDYKYLPYELTHTEIERDEEVEGLAFQKWQRREKIYSEVHMDEIDAYDAEINRIPDEVEAEELRAKQKRVTFDSVINHVQDEVNSRKEGMAGFNRDATRHQSMIESPYQKYQAALHSKLLPNPKDDALFKRKGQLFSEEMDDKSLRNFVIETGLTEEKRRQRYALSSAQGNEIFLRYSLGISQNTTLEDSHYAGKGRFAMFGYEFHLQNASTMFRRWTTEVLFQYGFNYYSHQKTNIISQEYSFAPAVNYYFYNDPSSIDQFIWYVGTGFRFGEGIFRAYGRQDQAYQFTSIPYLHGGMKFRFIAGDEFTDVLKVGVALNTNMAYERISFLPNGTSDDTFGAFSNYDLRGSLGLSFYF